MDNLRRRVDVADIFDPVTGRGIVDGHEAVDFKLPSGLLWATCNIGADEYEYESRPRYFLYGDTVGLPYSWGDQDTSGITTYNNYQSGEYNLPQQYDAAVQQWGGGWRMPTKEDWMELINNTFRQNYSSQALYMQMPNGTYYSWRGVMYFDQTSNRKMYFTRNGILDRRGAWQNTNGLCVRSSTARNGSPYVFSDDGLSSRTLDYDYGYLGQYTVVRPVHDPI